MHEAAYDELGMEARYVTFEPDPDELTDAIRGAEALGIAGLNVTIPFKEDVLDLVDPDPVAQRVGAVNTVDFMETPPAGYNTDVAGVVRSFDHHNVTLSGNRAVVVGAGGAGRACAFALADAGASVTIANRTAKKAHDLAADVATHTNVHTEGDSLEELEGLIAEAAILINATSVGMEEDTSPVPRKALHADLVVLDAVYRPLDTRLLRDAGEVGATTIDGAWMLLYQGVEAFERWTGTDAPLDTMNAALRERL